MCKKFLAEELKKVFGLSQDVDFSIVKKALKGLVLYGTVMFITFCITAGFAAIHFVSISVIFGFLLAVEISILSLFFGFLISLIFAYYVAFFVRKGWERPLN
jgi:hypothetical protein